MHNYGIIRKWMKSLTSGERIEFNLQKKSTKTNWIRESTWIE